MRSIAWMSEKGGTAKTTSCVNTAVGLAKRGKKVLVVDADPQANATQVFLKGEEPDGLTLYHVLTGIADAGDTIRETTTPGLHLLAADSKLAEANILLAGEVGRERRLRKAMRGVEDGYDFVIIDTSPQRSLLNINVLNYVAEVYCTIDPSVFSLKGLSKLQGAVAEVVEFLDNQTLTIAGLVVARLSADNLSRDVEARLRATCGSLVLKTTIPASVKVGEAHARSMSVLDYAPRSPAALAYRALTSEILANGTKHRTASGIDVASPADGANGRAGRRSRRAAG
jgi:chromosome partitioning protein